MRRICYSKFHVGDRFYGEKEPFDNQDETHGFCPHCLALELQKLEEELNEIRTRDEATRAAL